MTNVSHSLKTLRPHIFLSLPWILSITVLGLTAIFAYQAKRAEHEREDARFKLEVEETVDRIQNRIQVYINFLVATRAHLMLQPSIRAENFYPYTAHLGIDKNFPGLRGVGYAERITGSDVALVNRMQREGYPSFSIFPDYTAEERYPILYLYPQDEANQTAIGFDMFSESIRRAAMTKARDTGQPYSTGRVKLVQDVGKSSRGAMGPAGFLIFLPIYSTPTPATLEERSLTVLGFIFSPFRVEDLLAGIFELHPQRMVEFAVYDADDLNPDTLVYDSAALESSTSNTSPLGLTSARTIEVAGRPWRLIFRTGPSFQAHQGTQASHLLVITGALIAPLFFLVGWLISWSHRRTERQREWLRVTLASIGDAVIATDHRGCVLFMNSTAEELLQWNEREAIGIPTSRVLQLCDHDSQESLEDPAARVLASGEALSLSGNLALKRRSGDLIPIEDSTSPIMDSSGHVTGAILVFHDVSARKQKERFETTRAEVVRLLAYATTLDQVAEDLVKAVCRGLRCDGGTLWTLDESANGLRRRGGIGNLHYDHTFAQRVISEARAVWSAPPVAAAEEVDTHCNTGAIRTMLGFPLVEQGQVRGALDLVARREISLDDHTLQWLTSLGLQIGQMIERKQQETRRKAILEGAFDSIISFNAHGDIVDMNEAAETMFHVTREQLQGRSIREILDFPTFEISQLSDPGNESHFNRLTSMTGRVSRGESLPLELTITKTIVDATPLFTAFVRKLSEQSKRQTELVIQNQILHNMTEGVCLADEAGVIIFNNKALEDIFGYFSGEMIGKKITVVLGAQHENSPNSIISCVKEFGSFRGEIEIRRRDNSVITTLTQVSEISFSGQRYFLCVQDDITDRKKAESDRTRLLESERAARGQLERVSQIKDEFLATLSHELRTPLNAILGWSQLIKRGVLDQGRLNQGLEVIEKNARAQAQIIGDLLDMSRIVSGKVRLETVRIDIASVVDAAVETISPTALLKGVRIEKHLSPLLGTLRGDPNRLQQVFWNLLSNAVRFSTPGGRVIVCGATSTDGVEISVRDFGEGIKPEFVPHVFDRFRQGDASTTRKHGGLGLGLSIVKQLVELHGGEVSASSEGSGKGATFTVKLPPTGIGVQSEAPHEEQQEQDRHPYQSDIPSLQGKQVMAIDDEEDARNLLKVILEEQGAVVTTAASAQDAMDALELNKPDLIVSDISMPEEDGYTFIRKLRARSSSRGGDIPAVALTAFARPEDHAQALAAGFQVHLTKPIDPAKLVSSVARILGQ